MAISTMFLTLNTLFCFIMILLVRVVLLQKYRIGTRYRNKELLCRKKFIGMCPGTFSLLYKKDPGQLKKSGTCIYYSCHTISSLIQTILSVLEFHQISCSAQVADYTAGGEFHPAPKNDIYLFDNRISHFYLLCNHFLSVQVPP